MWGCFFESIGGHNNADSAYLGSYMHTDPLDTSFSHSKPQWPPEVHPNNSASVANDASALGFWS